MGIATGVDVALIQDAAAETVRPMIPEPPWADRESIVQGYEGVYSSLLLHARGAAERYGVPAHELLTWWRGYLGGQEDMLIDVAVELAALRRRGA